MQTIIFSEFFFGFYLDFMINKLWVIIIEKRQNVINIKKMLHLQNIAVFL